MKKFVLALMLCLWSSNVCWADQIFVLTEPTKVIFWNSYTNTGPVANEWQLSDITWLGLPITTKAVFIQGSLNITGPRDPQAFATFAPGVTVPWVPICNAYFFARSTAPREGTEQLNSWGEGIPNWFGMGQAVASVWGAGVRETIGTWVPVVDGKFAWKWTRRDTGEAEWPTGCSYGGNFNVQAWTE